MKLACFLKVRQKLTESRLSKSRYSLNFQARFVGGEKSFVSFDFLSFEGRRINFGANKPKLRRFEMRLFRDKMRPFVQFQRVPFGKSTQKYK